MPLKKEITMTISKTITSFSLFFLMASAVIAGDFVEKIKYSNFKDAEKASQYIKIHMESTKFGMLTTGFDGWVKSFGLSGTVKGASILNAVVEFKLNDLDTDNKARDIKMNEDIFETEKYPNLKVKLVGPLTVGKTGQKLKAIFSVRGKNKPSQFTISTSKVGNQIKVIGKGVVKLSKLEIPDPSIFIAKVRDEVDIDFEFLVNE